MNKRYQRLYKNHELAQQLPSIPKKIEAVKKDDSTEIIIYGDIGENWWGDSISASDIDAILTDITTPHINVRINSPGGDAFDGITIYNRLKNHQASVKIFVDGYACSAASIIAMAGDEIVMNEGSMMMIHRASTFEWGNANCMEKQAELLRKLDGSLVGIYAKQATELTTDEIEQLVDNETWFTADEAVEMGFATSKGEKEETTKDPEAFKQSILNRFKQQAPQPFLNKFKTN